MQASCSTYLECLSEPIAQALGLTNFPKHADAFVLSFALFTLVHLVISPILSRRFAPESYGKASRRARNSWSVHVVSQVHAIIILPLAWRCLGIESLNNDRIFGWDDRAGLVEAVACGYFLWDSLDAAINFIDVGFLLHGVACLMIYLLSFRPFLAYYGPRCLFWEASTFFLNIHWFLDKTGRTGTTLQLINGVLLLSTFLGVRIIWGGKMSYDFHQSLYEVRHQIPFGYYLVYSLGNVALNTLNWLWFVKMISALRKRFADTPEGKKNIERATYGTMAGPNSVIKELENGQINGEY